MTKKKKTKQLDRTTLISILLGAVCCIAIFTTLLIHKSQNQVLAAATQCNPQPPCPPGLLHMIMCKFVAPTNDCPPVTTPGQSPILSPTTTPMPTPPSGCYYQRRICPMIACRVGEECPPCTAFLVCPSGTPSPTASTGQATPTPVHCVELPKDVRLPSNYPTPPGGWCPFQGKSLSNSQSLDFLGFLNQILHSVFNR